LPCVYFHDADAEAVQVTPENFWASSMTAENNAVGALHRNSMLRLLRDVGWRARIESVLAEWCYTDFDDTAIKPEFTPSGIGWCPTPWYVSQEIVTRKEITLTTMADDKTDVPKIARSIAAQRIRRPGEFVASWSHQAVVCARTRTLFYDVKQPTTETAVLEIGEQRLRAMVEDQRAAVLTGQMGQQESAEALSALVKNAIRQASATPAIR
jgi:hypothetical protein